MILEVAFYDKYYDIPLRGIVSTEGHRFAFLAEIDQEAGDERWLLGVPAEITLFDTAPELESEFGFIDARFRQWKEEGAQGEHPLSSESQYAEAIKRIDGYFDDFRDSVRVLSGLFSIEGESWVFRSDPDDPD